MRPFSVSAIASGLILSITQMVYGMETAELLEQNAYFIHCNNKAMGTGFLASEDGIVISAAHVVVDPTTKKPGEILGLRIVDGKVERHTMKVVKLIGGSDKCRDIAILRLDVKPTDVPVLKI